MPDATKIFKEDDEWTKIRKPGILVVNNGDFTGIDNSLIGWQIKANQAKNLPPNSEVIDKINEKLKAKIDKGKTPKVLISYNWVKEDETEIELDLVKNEDYDVIIVPSMYVFSDGSSTNSVIGKYTPDLYNILKRLNQKIDLTIDDSTEDAYMTIALLAELNEIDDKDILQNLNQKINTFTINATSPAMGNYFFRHAKTNFRKGYDPILINIIYDPSYTNISEYKRPSFAFLQYKSFKTSSHSQVSASPPNVTLTIDISAVENYLLKRCGTKTFDGNTEKNEVKDELLKMADPSTFAKFSYNVIGLKNRPEHENEKVKKIVDDFYLDWLIVSENLKDNKDFADEYLTNYNQDGVDDDTKNRIKTIETKFPNEEQSEDSESQPEDNPPPLLPPNNNTGYGTGNNENKSSLKIMGTYDPHKAIPKPQKSVEENEKAAMKKLKKTIIPPSTSTNSYVSPEIKAHAQQILTTISKEEQKQKELEKQIAETNKPAKKQTNPNNTYQPPISTPSSTQITTQNNLQPLSPNIGNQTENKQKQSYTSDIIGGLIGGALTTFGALGLAKKTPLPKEANVTLTVVGLVMILFFIANAMSKKNIENKSEISLKNDTRKKQI